MIGMNKQTDKRTDRIDFTWEWLLLREYDYEYDYNLQKFW